MSRKNKPVLVILIEGLNSNKPDVFQQESDLFLERLNASVHKKNSVIVYNDTFHTPYDSPSFVASTPQISFYDIISGNLKTYAELIKKSRTVINIIHNTEDFLDNENKIFIGKFLQKANNCAINFFTNVSSNEIKALDFGVVASVYSPTSAGIQTMFSRMTDRTLNFLRGK